MNRKAILLIVIVLQLLTIKQLYAIDFSIETKIGYNFSRFSGTDSVSFRNISGFQVGPYLRIDFLKSISLNIEALYSQKGSVLKYDFHYNNPIEQKARLNYFEMPVVLSIKPLKIGPIHPAICLGYYAAPIIDMSNEIDSEFDEILDIYATRYFPFDHGYIIGSSFEVDLGNFRPCIELRYSRSQTSAYKANNFTITETGDYGSATRQVYLSTISIFINFRFINKPDAEKTYDE